MPELAAIYFAGFLVTFLMGSIFGLGQRARYQSTNYLNLQSNLRKAGYRWNELNLAIEKTNDPDKDQADEYDKARMSMMIFIGGASVLSWLGLLFLSIIWMTLRLVGKARTKQQIMASSLTQPDLSVAQIQEEIDRLST